MKPNRQLFAISIATIFALILFGLSLSIADDGERGFGGTGKQQEIFLNDQTKERGLGGTGKQDDYLNNQMGERGLGGTGKQLETIAQKLFDSERGLGGTGIIGTITKFGSIWVNGIEIELNEDTEITQDHTPANETSLRIGQQVEVVVQKDGEKVFAQNVAIEHQLIAPVEEVNHQQHQIKTLGQEIILADNAPGVWPTVAPGDTIRVSGYRNENDQIVATDIAVDTHQNQWLLQGTVTERGNQPYIGELSLQNKGIDVSVGDNVILRGELSDGSLRISDYQVKPELPFNGRVEHIYVEGTISPQRKQFRFANGHIRAQNLSAVSESSQRGFALISIHRNGVELNHFTPETMLLLEKMQNPDGQPVERQIRNQNAPARHLGARPRHDMERPHRPPIHMAPPPLQTTPPRPSGGGLLPPPPPPPL